MENILSPIDNKSKTKLVRKVDVSKIAKGYNDGFEIDVTRFFNNAGKEIEIRECLSTGFQFFYPSGIEGDGPFYQELEKYDWYYGPWKWEYDHTISKINKEDKFLEVGSGGNVFLSKLKELGYTNIVGLELNQNSVKNGKEKGLTVLSESIQEHSLTHKEFYDVTASFQVLEHIYDVHSFIQSSIDTLKPGGRLIVSVPNNNSYLGERPMTPLNLPPHHVGLWRPDSLRKLENHFNIKCEEIALEPFSKFRRPSFYSAIHENKKPYLYYKIARNFWPSLIERKYSKEFLAFTIQAQFIKK
jgi:2-polyprenyl-3-methyl-5-hydroxy-6-metoxy-1,4-benzoquinol methylase